MARFTTAIAGAPGALEHRTYAAPGVDGRMVAMDMIEIRSPNGAVIHLSTREAAMLVRVIRQYLVVAPSQESAESHRALARACDEIELVLRPPS